MRKDRALQGVAVLVGTLLLTACSRATTSEAPVLTNRAFAEQWVRDQFLASYLTCGDSYFADPYYGTVEEGTYEEMRGFVITIRERVLTSADRANGVEWEGSGEAGCEIYRFYLPDRAAWDLWRDCSPWSFTLRKQNGQWMYMSAEGYRMVAEVPTPALHGFTCSDIPH